MSGIDFWPGEILLIEHRPPDDPLPGKPRPAIVVSNLTFNRNGIDVVVAAISSVVRHRDPTQILIDIDAADFSQTGLKMTSAIKCGALFACPKNLIHRRLGRASTAILAQVRQVLVDFLTKD